MKEVYQDIKKLKKFNGHNSSVNIDSLCSFLHGTITSYLLFTSFIIASSKQHFGDPIKCFTDKKADQDQPTIPEQVINAFCFMSNTYSVVPATNTGLLNVSYAGQGPVSAEQHVYRHTYYMWVPFMMLLQAILFKIPHWLWASYEGGLVTKMVANLDEDLELRLPQLNRSEKIDNVADYFHRRCGQESLLIGIMWILCDLLALLNIFANFYFIDLLLGASFKKVLPLLNWTNVPLDPHAAAAFFPLQTKCHIDTYGSSGSVQRIDSICIMTLNSLYQKIFPAIWLWLYFLALCTLISISIKLVQIALLMYHSGSYWQNTISVPTKIDGYELTHCVSSMTFGDCVLFNLVTRNMRPMTYKAFVRELSNRKANKKP